ncbi:MULTISPECIES: hypothetical protein [Acidiplasma]|uniref:DNA primase large subunit PriL n=2 Tax=Acidiplasma cupricumulans TaxID=312540 RepID=A0A0Q0VK44_9ARCH|nr:MULTISPECIES: hypothetical protein [Acidiplasma]KQB33851.1 hypothetical protein AOG55_01885 [Acidiplasma cupricumulans]
MITDKFFVDYDYVSSPENINTAANSLSDRKPMLLALEYIKNIVKKYADKNRYNQVLDLKSFGIALWMIKLINQRNLTSRFIIEQRDVFENEILRLIKNDIESFIDYCHRAKINVFVSNNIIKIPFNFFITYNKKISGFKYRLIYQKMENGLIIVDEGQIAHLLRENFVEKINIIYNSINIDQAAQIFKSYQSEINLIRDEFIKINAKNEMKLGDVDFTKFPPCIIEYLNEIRDNQNLPHLARFTLVSFLHSIGMSNADMINIFRNVPDFNEKMTTYQVEHITGIISGTEYSPPKCVTLRSNHLCYMDDDPLCRKINHPLEYYKKKKFRKS